MSIESNINKNEIESLKFTSNTNDFNSSSFLSQEEKDKRKEENDKKIEQVREEIIKQFDKDDGYIEPETYSELPVEIKELVIQGIEDLNNSEAFKKMHNLGIENPKEFITFLKKIEITINEDEDTHIAPYTNTPEDQFDIYYINLKPSNDEIHGKNIKHDIAHEFGHVIQKYLKEKKLPQITDLDKKTLSLIPHMNSSLPYFEKIIQDENISFEKRKNIKYVAELKERYPKLFENEMAEEEQIAKDLLYFINGSGGLERLAFLRETRQELFNNGITKSFQDEITPAELERLIDLGESNRILSFLNKDSETLKTLADLLNETP